VCIIIELGVLELSDIWYKVSEVDTGFLKQMRERTISAIRIISVSYIICFLLIGIMAMSSHLNYWVFPLIVPMFVYLWVITYGGKKHVNNQFSFKTTSEGIIVYKKSASSYSTYTLVWMLIFYISSIIRVFHEVRNLNIINEVLRFRSE